MDKKVEERFFSVELKSKINLKTIALSNGGQENVLVEGTIGKLLSATFNDCVVLEVVGDQGILRINLTADEIKQKIEAEKEGSGT